MKFKNWRWEESAFVCLDKNFKSRSSLMKSIWNRPRIFFFLPFSHHHTHSGCIMANNLLSLLLKSTLGKLSAPQNIEISWHSAWGLLNKRCGCLFELFAANLCPFWTCFLLKHIYLQLDWKRVKHVNSGLWDNGTMGQWDNGSMDQWITLAS